MRWYLLIYGTFELQSDLLSFALMGVVILVIKITLVTAPLQLGVLYLKVGSMKLAPSTPKHKSKYKIA